MKKILVLCALVLWSLFGNLARADEASEREAIQAEVKIAFWKGEYASIENRYSELSSSGERLPSGTFKAEWVLVSLQLAVAGASLSSTATAEARARQETQYKAMLEKIEHWQKRYPTSSLAAHTRANCHVYYAFFFRGTRLAREVEPADWKRFDDQINLAFDALESGSNPLPRDVAWYSAMLRLLTFKSNNLQDFAQFVDDASDQHPASLQIYFSAVQRLLPKWGGSVEALDWLANLALSKTRDKEGMALYTRVYRVVSATDFENDLFVNTRADWKKMKLGFEDMVKQYPTAFNLNHFASFACMARDQATLKQLFDKLGSEIDPDIWNVPQRLNRCRSLANGE